MVNLPDICKRHEPCWRTHTIEYFPWVTSLILKIVRIQELKAISIEIVTNLTNNREKGNGFYNKEEKKTLNLNISAIAYYH